MSDEFIPPQPLNTAVLFLVFNRLDTTKQVFEAIKEAKPPRLYIAADGARTDKEGEAEKVTAVRDFIMQNIDWECDVENLFRDENLGCKYAVSGAINWFFDNEEMGIILEDDCLPSQSFFWYCEELLARYKDDMRVWHISGDNFQKGVKRGDGDYYFSKFNHIWGWASWSNRWEKYDVKIKNFSNFNETNLIKNIFENKKQQDYWSNIFLKVSRGEIDTWDYQWTYAVLANSGLSILPNNNLISNIGFGEGATHTSDLESEFSKLSKEDIPIPMSHPAYILANRAADEVTSRTMFIGPSFFSKAMQKLKRIINK